MSESESQVDGETDWVEETFSERVEAEEDVTLDDVRSWYEQKLDEYGNEKLARVTVQSEFNSFLNSGADGNVQIITIGAEDDPFNNGDVFLGFGLCIPEDSPVRIGAILFDRGDVNPDPWMDYFYEPFTPIQGDFDIRDAQKPVGSNAYTLNAVEQTEVSVWDTDRDQDQLREMVMDHVPEAKIANLGDALSLTNDKGFAAAFGVDMRVIADAYVHEANVGENGARLVLQDDSFVDARDLDDSVRGEDGDAGLNAFIDPELVTFGEGSIVDVFGPITMNDDGKVMMSVKGVDVEYATEAPSRNTSSSSGGSGGSDNEPDEQRTI